MKKMFIYLFALSFMFVGVNSVSAKIFNEFKKGDEISVKLNENESGKFYVLDDKGDYVIAIYKDVLGDVFYFGPGSGSLGSSFEASKACSELRRLTESWIYPNTKDLISAQDIKSDLDLENQEQYDMKDQIFHIGKSYWTKTIVNGEGENYFPYLVTSWSTYSNLHTAISESPANVGYIRPVINIDKIYVEEAAIKITSWDQFINSLKEYLDVQIAGMKLSYTDKSLEIKSDDETHVEKYSYDGKLLTLTEIKETETFGYISVDEFLYYTNLKYFEYDSDTEYINDSDTQLSISTDENLLFKFLINLKDGQVESARFENYSVNLSYFLDIQSSDQIKNDEKSENQDKTESKDQKQEEIKNPNTGINTQYKILSIVVLLGIVTYLIIKKKSKFPKHN